MLETLLICDFFFDGDPEFILLMMYILLSLLGSFLRSSPFPPVWAPHLMDSTRAVEAAVDNSSRYCGDTLGETIANCGVTVAWKAYSKTARHAVKRIQQNTHRRGNAHAHGHGHGRRNRNNNSNNSNNPDNQRMQRSLRRVYFEVLGRWINFVEDTKTWIETVDLSKLAVSTAARVGARVRNEWEVVVRHWNVWRVLTQQQPDWKRAAATTLEYGWALAQAALLSAARTLLRCVPDMEPGEFGSSSSSSSSSQQHNPAEL
eukprot:jgi/Psemu1/283689/fgenesh1_pg.31_\